jgi:hypothetical protein
MGNPKKLMVEEAIGALTDPKSRVVVLIYKRPRKRGLKVIMDGELATERVRRLLYRVIAGLPEGNPEDETAAPLARALDRRSKEKAAPPVIV